MLNESVRLELVYTYRQVIILRSLANWVTFIFSLDIEHWQVKEHFSPWGHFWKSPKVTDSLRHYQVGNFQNW